MEHRVNVTRNLFCVCGGLYNAGWGLLTGMTPTQRGMVVGCNIAIEDGNLFMGDGARMSSWSCSMADARAGSAPRPAPGGAHAERADTRRRRHTPPRALRRPRRAGATTIPCPLNHFTPPRARGATRNGAASALAPPREREAFDRLRVHSSRSTQVLISAEASVWLCIPKTRATLAGYRR